MMSSKYAYIPFILLSHFSLQVHSVVVECGADKNDGCTDKKKALALKIIAIISILITSMIGVCLPFVARSVPVLSPHSNLFVMVKAFAAGIILATGLTHIFPEALDMQSSTCLKQNPWHKFPFTGFVAILSAIITLLIDTMTTSFFSKRHKVRQGRGRERRMAGVNGGHHHGGNLKLRYRVIASVLQLGVTVHSILIGLSLGASNNTCSIEGLMAALCFQHMFEGMELGGSFLQVKYKFIMKAAMVFSSSVTTPFGIALGIALSKSYKENNTQSLITVGLLNASSAGQLIYMALVDLLAKDFMGPKLRGSVKLQIMSCMAVLLGAGVSLAKWA